MLTWLGAGDVVEAGVAGGNYGYALMWIVVVALLIRFLFVSLIAKYQLLQPARRGRARRPAPPAPLLRARAAGRLRGHGPRLRRVHGGRAWARPGPR